MIPPHKHTSPDNVDSWLMSYADMITLLMCFFIIFVSVSEPKKEKLNAITRGMTNKFGSVDLSAPLQALYHSLQQLIEDKHLLQDVAVDQSQTAIAIELSTPAFYQPGSAEFNPDKLPQLTALAKALRNGDILDYRISITGYTSDEPMNMPSYPSNWEFSTARAARMVRFFIDNGISPDHLEAVGLADTHPKVDNLDKNGTPIPENRQKNERIVIKLERIL